MQAGGQVGCNFAVIDDGFVVVFDGHVMAIQEAQRALVSELVLAWR
jgi:hypothetical protein